jgi:peroxiredoxin Q/BCP
VPPPRADVREAAGGAPSSPGIAIMRLCSPFPASMAKQTVKDFSLPSTGDKTFTLSESQARYVVLYFYPKDNTPGCTDEGRQFRDLYSQFKKLGCEIVGVSRDSLKSHESFKAKMEFPFELLADEDEVLCTDLGVMKMKNMYGKQVRGIERSTFVIDGERRIEREWRGVKVPGHAEEVLAFVRTL